MSSAVTDTPDTVPAVVGLDRLVTLRLAGASGVTLTAPKVLTPLARSLALMNGGKMNVSPPMEIGSPVLKSAAVKVCEPASADVNVKSGGGALPACHWAAR